MIRDQSGLRILNAGGRGKEEEEKEREKAVMPTRADAESGESGSHPIQSPSFSPRRRHEKELNAYAALCLTC